MTFAKNTKTAKQITSIFAALILTSIFLPLKPTIVFAQQTVPFYSRTFSETARSADTFVDSIGINTHLDYSDTNYFKQYESIVKPRLAESGIRHVRQGVPVEEAGDAWNWLKLPWRDRIRELHSQYGIKFNVGGGSMYHDPAGILEQVKKIDPQASFVESFEGQNEYDLLEFQGKTKAEIATSIDQHVMRMHEVFKSDPATKEIPIIAPSWTFMGQEVEDNSFGPYVDLNNSHPYYDPKSGDTDDHYNIIFDSHSKTAASKPMAVTEFGWSTGKHDRAVSPAVQNKYMLRNWLKLFNMNVKRSYSYELLDLWSDPYNRDNNFGLLYNNGTPKPAFNTMKNTISLLSDKNAPATPAVNLGFSIQSNNQGSLDKVQYSVLNKANGKIYLALWLGVESSDQYQYLPSTIKFDRAFQSINLIRPSTSLQAINLKVQASEATVNIADEVVFLELTPNPQTQTQSSQAAINQPAVSSKRKPSKYARLYPNRK